MYDFRIFEMSEHLHDSITFTDVRKEFIPEAFAFGSSFYKPGDIDEFHVCENGLLRF